jgi:uncharacterized protein YjbJ (UPF0337 family)
MEIVTQQLGESRWDRLVGRVRRLWGDISEDDLMRAQGNYDRLILLLTEKTGKSREELESLLDEKP